MKQPTIIPPQQRIGIVLVAGVFEKHSWTAV
jgi:hypothetical protein